MVFNQNMDAIDNTQLKFYQLHRYATLMDWVLMFVGSLSAVVSGARFPAFWLLYGNVQDMFTEFGIELRCRENCTHAGYNNQSSLPKYGTGTNTTFGWVVAEKLQSIAILGVLVMAISALQASCWSLYGYRQAAKIRVRLFRAILDQDVDFLESTDIGNLKQLLNEDVNHIQLGISEKVSFAINSFVTGLFSVALALWLSWKLTLVALAMVPLFVSGRVLIIWSYGISREKEHKCYAQASSVAHEAISSIRTITSFGCQQQRIDRYRRHLQDSKIATSMGGLITGASMGWLRVTSGLLGGVSFWYGVQLFKDNELSGGEVVATIFSIVMMGRSFGEFVNGLDFFEKAIFAGTKVFALIDRKSQLSVFSNKGLRPKYLRSFISFKDVKFSYKSRTEVKVLDKFNLSIPEGKMVAIVGASGCGKTTVAKLLQRWHDVEYGSISIGGYDIRDLNLLWMRNQMSFVEQQPVLFNTTIAINIGCYREGVDRKQIEKAAQLANALEFILKLPDQFDTIVGDRGASLSGGQKQRIAIARALIRCSTILVLDEATSALDSVNESAIQDALQATQGRTTLVIAHRLNTIRHSDLICLLDGGKVAEIGTHDELMRLTDGAYKSLVEHQLDRDANCDSYHKSSTLDSIEKSEQTSIDFKLKHDGDEENAIMTNSDKVVPIPFFKVLALSKPESLFFAVGVISGILSGCANSAMGLVLGYFTDVFIETNSQALNLMIAFIAMSLVDGFFHFGAEAAFAKCSANLVFRLRCKLFGNLLRQEISYFDQRANKCSALTQLLAEDACSVSHVTIDRINITIKLLSSFGCSIIIAMVLSWQLALFAIGFLPLIAFSAYVQTRFLQRAVLVADVQFASEMISNLPTILGLANATTILTVYRNSFQGKYKLWIKTALSVGVAYGYSQTTMMMAFAAIFGLGSHLVLVHGLTPVNMLKVTVVIVYSAMSAGQRTSMTTNFGDVKLSVARIFKLLHRKSSIDPLASNKDHIKTSNAGDLVFEDVMFYYPTRPNNVVLDGVSFTIRNGETLALVGPSGCGKSSCVQLIQRFYDTQSGSIKLDGRDIRDLDVSWLRYQLGVVEQEPILFDETLTENIKLGLQKEDEDIDIKQLVKVLKLQDIWDKVGTSKIGRGGILISVGERQRVAVARALARNPALLLLDEATASLDAENEKLVQEAINVAKEGRTCLIVAHRLSTVMNADRIAVLNGGKIVEVGTHSELLKLNGAYSTLIEAQYLKD